MSEPNVLLVFDSCAAVFDASPLPMDRGSRPSRLHSATSYRHSVVFPFEILVFCPMIMVSQPRGRHVLPHQELRLTLLPPDRREPLGRRATATARHRDPGTTRSTPAVRTTRRPPRLGRAPGPVRPP